MAEKISLTRGRNGFFSWINKTRNINTPVDLPRFTKYRPTSLPMVKKEHASWFSFARTFAKVLAKGQIAWHARAIQRSQFPLNKFRVFASRLLENFGELHQLCFIGLIAHECQSCIHYRIQN